MIEKRLYLGGLNNEISIQEISKILQKFGICTDFEFKTNFCFFTLTATNLNSIQLALKTLSNTKWKGNLIILEFAKISKLQKLRIERQKLKIESKGLGEKKIINSYPIEDGKHWIKINNNLVARLKIRMPKTGRQKTIDPYKYSHQHVIFNSSHNPNPNPEPGLGLGLLNLSKDYLQNQRKRAGIFTPQEVNLAKDFNLKLKMKRLEIDKIIRKSKMSRRKYFKNIEQQELMEKEINNLILLANNYKDEDSNSRVFCFDSDQQKDLDFIDQKFIDQKLFLFDSD